MTAERVADAYVRFRARVEAAAARILRDRDEAADVASEAFLAMLERGPDSEAATLAWLLASARNRALNRVRARTREARRAVAAAPREAEPEVTAAIAPVGLVAGAAARLAARDRRALELRFVENLSYEAVATALAVTPAQARVVVHRATRRLRKETVMLLAEYHGASSTCRRAILTGAMNGGIKAHPGCVPCTSVADEVAALAARGLLPFAPATLPAVGRFVEAVAGRATQLPTGRFAEALAALLVAGAGVLIPPAPVPAAIASSPAGPVAGAARHVAPTTSQDLTSMKAPARAVLRAASPGLIQDDPSGDGGPLLESPAQILRLPLAMSDPLHDASGGRDVRRFEVGVTHDRSAIVFRFSLAGRPPSGTAYTASWKTDGDCDGSAVARTADQGTAALERGSATFTMSCPAAGGLFTTGEMYDAPATSVAGEDFVDIAVAFRGMSPELARLFAPGALLRGVTGSTSEVVGSVWVGRDYVPDEGVAPDYRIPR